MAEYGFDPESGLPVFPCEAVNKYNVKLTVRALLDISSRESRISYRIFSALGFDTTNPAGGSGEESFLGNVCHAWLEIREQEEFRKISGDFVISQIRTNYDVVIGLGLISSFFDIQILPSKKIFTLTFQNKGK